MQQSYVSIVEQSPSRHARAKQMHPKHSLCMLSAHISHLKCAASGVGSAARDMFMPDFPLRSSLWCLQVSGSEQQPWEAGSGG